VLWIVLFAALLGGVVAVNVAVLRLNLERDRVGHERSELRADIARLRSELSSAAASARIERLAQKELGLIEADPETTVFVRLTR
jgi:cell division protein FtsL